MLYHAGGSPHTQNIQTNRIIGKNEKCVFFFFTENNIQTFWPT